MKKIIKTAFRVLGLEVNRFHQNHPLDGQVSLNVGSGGSRLPGFVNLDIPSRDYYKRNAKNFIECDIARDPLPYKDATVDRIYLSHVIEHLDGRGAKHFLNEASRVLKRGGVCRIVTPDAEFLWNVSVFDNRFWDWKREARNGGPSPRVQDSLQRVIYSPGFDRNVQILILKDSEHSDEMYRQLDLMTSGSDSDVVSPKDHISYWTFEKLRRLVRPNFSRCIRSTYWGSLDPVMAGSLFDQRGIRVSLYVDLVK